MHLTREMLGDCHVEWISKATYALCEAVTTRAPYVPSLPETGTRYILGLGHRARVRHGFMATVFSGGASAAGSTADGLDYAALCKLLGSEEAADRERAQAALKARGGAPDPRHSSSLDWKRSYGLPREREWAEQQVAKDEATRVRDKTERDRLDGYARAGRCKELSWGVFLLLLCGAYVGLAIWAIVAGVQDELVGWTVVGAVMLGLPCLFVTWVVVAKPTFGFAK